MLVIKNLNKTYKSKNEEVKALKNINLEFGNKGFIVLLGKSGSGKSTLLNILGGLDHFESGEIIIKNKSTKDFKPSEWDSYRNTYVGFVFQEFYIIEEFTVGKNISLALELQGFDKEKTDEKVYEILKQVDLEGYQDRKPNAISGGQKQRIAIARALVKNPQIILADEPTGNLDSETGRLILETLKKLSEEKLVIMVTHDEDFARKYGDRIIELKDGNIINDTINTTSHLDNEEVYLPEKQFNQIIKLPKGKPLSNHIIDKINDLLSTANKDVFMSVTKNNQYISQYIDLNESQDMTKEVLERLNSEDQVPFGLKKSSLSYINGFKLALSSIFKKKILLVFMSLLFIIALTFVGISTTLSFYDATKATIITFKEKNVNEIPLLKKKRICLGGEKNFCNFHNISFTDEELSQLKQEFPSITFTKTIDMDLDFYYLRNFSDPTEHSPYYANSFTKSVIIDSSQFDGTLVSGTLPTELGEILITDFLAESIVVSGYLENVNSNEALINKSIDTDDYSLVIKGIVDTDFETYNYLKDDIDKIWSSGFETVKRSIYSSMYMTLETFETYINSQSYLYTLSDVTENSYSVSSEVIIPPKESYLSSMVESSRLPVNDGEIVIQSYLLNILFNDFINTDNENVVKSYLGKTITLDLNAYEKYMDNPSKTYTIVGIIKNNPEVNPIHFSYMFSKEEYNYFSLSNLFNYDYKSYTISTHAELGSNNTQLSSFVKTLDRNNYHHQTAYSSLIYQIKDFSENGRRIFLYIGGVFTLFASLLIFTFISTSIRLKQKEIGTLRAIGARGIDVSKIFVTEGMIIAIFAAIIANIVSSILISIFNNLFTKEFKISITLLFVNIYSILLVFALSIIIVFLSSLIPLKRIVLMRPIKAIKNLKR